MGDLIISVLLPAFNAEKYIRLTIDSILNQTYQNFELLVADDASTDNTRQIIDSYKDHRIKTFHNSKNLKKPLTVQKLYKQSTGDLITIHDADDLSLPTRFETIVTTFRQNPDVYMCGHNIERITEEGKPLGLYRIKVSEFDVIKELMKKDNTDGDPSIFIKREVIEDIGVIYRPYFENNMDYDLALRIIEKYKSTNVVQVLAYYRNVPNSISKGVPTYHKLITQDITKSLAEERRSGKQDALQRNDFDEIRKLEDKFARPYIEDDTLHFRKMAGFFMYCKMNKSAINYMIMAIKRNPFKIENWSTLQYCIRKTFLGI